jgi:hypothetical protein
MGERGAKRRLRRLQRLRRLRYKLDGDQRMGLTSCEAATNAKIIMIKRRTQKKSV